MTWKETGGPPVSRPEQKRGFGTRLMARAFGSSGTATLDFEPDGVICRIKLQLEADRAMQDDSEKSLPLPMS